MLRAIIFSFWCHIHSMLDVIDLMQKVAKQYEAVLIVPVIFLISKQERLHFGVLVFSQYNS